MWCLLGRRCVAGLALGASGAALLSSASVLCKESDNSPRMLQGKALATALRKQGYAVLPVPASLIDAGKAAGLELHKFFSDAEPFLAPTHILELDSAKGAYICQTGPGDLTLTPSDIAYALLPMKSRFQRMVYFALTGSWGEADEGLPHSPVPFCFVTRAPRFRPLGSAVAELHRELEKFTRGVLTDLVNSQQVPTHLYRSMELSPSFMNFRFYRNARTNHEPLSDVSIFNVVLSSRLWGAPAVSGGIEVQNPYSLQWQAVEKEAEDKLALILIPGQKLKDAIPPPKTRVGQHSPDRRVAWMVFQG
eukprot:TRINITY_DN18563_c0_g1_i1.p1 TRINITY_DN18563_c0_g1~~TRINITY_DN18563_c0_g1_i1.p1  ORF type:complete len:314 (+),score=56.79 TRINITY_DN18563_c0_g1_i1:27-944(+)